MREYWKSVRSETLASSDGVELALHHLGGQGPTLLICHATGFHGRAYVPLAQAIADRFDVWAVDLRGHGDSTAPRSGDFRWPGMAEDVENVLDRIGRPAIGFGHSMGGAAILLAELDRPGSFSAAYLYEPIVLPENFNVIRPENPLAIAARKRRAVFADRAEAFSRYGRRPPLDELALDALEAYVEFGFVDMADGSVRLACDPEDEARTFECDTKVTHDVVRGMSFDVVVAAGASVPGISPSDFAPEIVDAIDGAVLRPHPELGHFGPLEDPVAIGAEIIELFG